MNKKFLIHIYNNRIIRYIIFGGLTTLVNLCSYFVFRTFVKMNVNKANIISIIIAILFAYTVNSKFVFESNCNNLKEKFYEFIKFISARISTMLIEVIGVFIFVNLLQFNDFISKILIQFVVLVLNYVFSKLIVFKTENESVKIS
ncbi:GtrA family protein [Anaerocolumna aminovalerica]|nr:GtrA family protein [Anaerocolumna aminovalerica]